MKRVGVLALIAAGLFSSNASAEPANVQGLLDQCNSEMTASEFLYCLGYVGGVSDVMILNGIIAKNNPSIDPVLKRFATCPSSAVSRGASRQAFVNWAQKHPEQWTLGTTQGVVFALRDVWPCR